MRLKKLKLAGFKSFVDPTTIAFPSQLVSIVGPNGCGKSNTIDAVRWVMGESSAKHLRGENLTDVIFNGSSNRKPVGQATVELIFDNSDQTVVGEYANYAEISVKRTVTRDGQSTYFLNGSKCRRRDISDIIMGTGVGPRSYAIIEQGMISRLIEARPEELRTHLEEVAGIAKYKERRRETENRIKHTRENLERLEDLREELNKQLEHLHKQAKAAERYKQLKADEELWTAQLKAVRWQSYNDKLQRITGDVSVQQTELEKQIASLRSIEADIERDRQGQIDANDALQEAQSQYYQQGATVSRLEQTIKHHRERATQLSRDLEETKLSYEQAQSQLNKDEQELEEVSAKLLELTPEKELLQAKQSESTDNLTAAEDAMRDWQKQWDAFIQESSLRSKQADIEQAKIVQLEKGISQTQQRLERLLAEAQGLNEGPLADEHQLLIARQQEVEQQLLDEQQLIDEHRLQIQQQRQESERAEERLAQIRRQLEQEQGKQASLEALQQAALGRDDSQFTQYLTDKGLDTAPKLAELIDVQSGYEKAVEAVLQDRIQAVCIANLDQVAAVIDDLPQGQLNLVELSDGALSSALDGAIALEQVVSTKQPIGNLLADIFVVDELSTALHLRNSLSAQQSIVTKDGIWLGRHWLRVAKGDVEKSGLLARKKVLEQTTAHIQTLEDELEQAKADLDSARARIVEIEQARDDAQAQLNEIRQQQGECKAKVSALSTQIEQQGKRRATLEIETEEAQAYVEDATVELKQARKILQDAIDSMASDEETRQDLQAARDRYQEQLQLVRSAANQDKEHYMQVFSTHKTLEMQKTTLAQHLERNQSQIGQFKSRTETLAAKLRENEDPISGLELELNQALAKHGEYDNVLQEIRAKADAINNQIRGNELARSQCEQKAQEIRTKLENVRLSAQALEVKRNTIAEDLKQSEQTLEELLEALPEQADEELWAEELERIRTRISRLGAINLAAIEEYEVQSERKNYLDTQHDDLIDALETLEVAINKIDKETKERFKETFDFVNSSLQEFFPRMFGGGQAYLELTDEDLLTAGVSIIARPPGKRNATIHLLSGGEKALTAIALVFSLFKLNPAPFCILDEVDAPLDDTNVERFTKLVAEMSSSVQFIFITHNKITMEMADQLMGVTMREPGVSRIVSVDVEEATKMVESA